MLNSISECTFSDRNSEADRIIIIDNNALIQKMKTFVYFSHINIAIKKN